MIVDDLDWCHFHSSQQKPKNYDNVFLNFCLVTRPVISKRVIILFHIEAFTFPVNWLWWSTQFVKQ